jgi:hypothetical protein
VAIAALESIIGLRIVSYFLFLFYSIITEEIRQWLHEGIGTLPAMLLHLDELPWPLHTGQKNRKSACGSTSRHKIEKNWLALRLGCSSTTKAI